MDGGTGSTLTRKRGWGTSGKLFTGNTGKIVTMQADLPFVGSYTVQFSISDSPTSNYPLFAEAFVTWGVEGSFVSRRLNVTKGASLTGVGQSVKIIMSDASPRDPTDGPPNGAEYSVACQVAPGVRGGSKQPPLLTPRSGFLAGGAPAVGAGGFFPVAAGGTTFIEVPNDAGVIGVFTTIAAAAPVAEFGALVTMLRGSFTLRVYDPRVDWVPLPPGTETIALINSTAGPIDFGVTFGIDG